MDSATNKSNFLLSSDLTTKQQRLTVKVGQIFSGFSALAWVNDVYF